MNAPPTRGFRLAFRRVAPAVALLAAAAGLAGCARKPAAATEQAPPRVVIAPAATDDHVNDFEDFTGRTEPYKVVEIRPQVTAALERIYFEDGEYVNAGDPLFELDDELYRADVDSVSAALKQAKADVGLAQVQVTLTKASYDRAEERRKKGNIGQEEYDQAVASRDGAAATLEKSQATVKVQEANLRRAEKLLGYTKIRAPESGRLSRRRVDRGNIVKENETVLTTLVVLDPVYVAFDMDERTLLRIRGRTIHEPKSPSLRGGELKVRVQLADRLSEQGDSYDKDKDEFDATVRFADNVLDPNTGTLRLRAEMDNPRVRFEKWLRYQPGQLPALVGAPGAMRLEERVTRLVSPGMFVRVRFPIGRPYRAILVPEEAIASEQGRKFVYVVRNPIDTGEIEKKDEMVNGQKVKVEYAIWKGTPELRGVNPGPQFERPGKDKNRPIVYRVVARADEKDPAVGEKDVVITTGLQRVRKNKDGEYVPVTWLVRKDSPK
jgi:RND family efflux transporter MFP subunit